MGTAPRTAIAHALLFIATAGAEGPALTAPPAAEEIATPANGESTAAILKPIGTITVDIAATGKVVPPLRTPASMASGEPSAATRPQVAVAFPYAAAATYHRGLLFQDINLERYGHHYGRVQPAVSAAHFTTRMLALPYSIVHERWRTPTYTLGFGRPGDPVPPRVYLGR